MTTEGTIDSVDLKILEFLKKDARSNLYFIAEECKLSSSAILARIKKLKDNKVIVGNHLIVRCEELGYPIEATVGVSTEVPKIPKIAEEIRSLPNVVVCTKSIGKYNMLCMVLARNMTELDNATHKIKNIDGVRGIAVNLILEHTFRSFDNKVQRQTQKKKHELDNIDVGIIKELMTDSSQPFTRIAKKLKVSHETVRRKFEKLKANGIIVSCHSIVDYSKLGYEGTVFIFITQIQGSDKTNIILDLKKLPHIYLINSAMGAFDLVAFALFKNLRDFTKLIDQIQQISGVGQIDIALANFTYFAYNPLPKITFECDTLELS